MSTGNQYTEENSKIHNWPWEEEEINAADYSCSLKGIKRFLAEVDVQMLHSLEDLSAVVSLVGHDLHAIVVAKGRKREKKVEQLEAQASEPLTSIEREYVLTKCIRGREIIVTASDGHIMISERRIVGFQGYQREELRVRLPADRDIAIGMTPNVDEGSLYALDLRSGSLKEYRPLIALYDAATQQAFTAVLADALADVVTLLPPGDQVLPS